MPLDLTAVTGALGALKALSGIAKDVNNIELNQKIIELQQKLLDIQIGYGNLVDENRALKAEIEAGSAYEFRHSVYWKAMPDDTLAGPFCPICYGTGKKAMPLEFHGNHTSGSMIFVCPIQHVPIGHGRNSYYHVPADLIPVERYAKPL